MNRPRTVLYVQHAGSLGGSCVSLRQIVSVLDRTRYLPVVALARPSRDLVLYYEKTGARVLSWPGLVTFEHTTAFWTSAMRPASWPVLGRTLVGWRKSERRTLELIDHVRPDLVHLNSVVLAASARAARSRGVPLVWHVRESPVPGHVGMRLALVRRALQRWPDRALFLSDAERSAWGVPAGIVVHNAVDMDRFDARLDRSVARKELGLAPDARVLLYVGGIGVIKGIFPLLEALSSITDIAGLVCLMPATLHTPSASLKARVARRVLPLICRPILRQRVEDRIRELGLEAVCRRMPFVHEVERLIAASDALVFPALENHFARPVIEAAAMGRPTIASRLPTLEEIVDDGSTGLLVQPGNVAALAGAIRRVLSDHALAEALGAGGRAEALLRYDLRVQAETIMRTYDEVLVERTKHTRAGQRSDSDQRSIPSSGTSASNSTGQGS